MSPTTAIRQRWSERFKDLFLDYTDDFSSLFSSDLHNVKLLNSVTYQALYTAIDKISTDNDEDIDCSDIDIFATMREFGITTVCLDEAHHLKNEWQKALGKFISALDKNDPEKKSNIWHLVTVEPEYLFKDKATARGEGGFGHMGVKSRGYLYIFNVRDKKGE